MADVAYKKNKFGTPFLAIVITFFVGMAFIFFRRLLIHTTELKCFEALEENLKTNGKLRIIKPWSVKK